MSETPSTGFWQRLEQIPRAYIYLLLAVVVIWQLVFPIRFEMSPSPSSKGVYDAIRAAPADKLIILSADWDASTEAETGPQTTAIMRAILSGKKKFAILNLVSPAGVKLADARAVAVAKEYNATRGLDWCNWGYKVGTSNVIIGLTKNIPGTVKSDSAGTPVGKIPMMAQVHDARDIGLVIEISGSAMTEYWIQFFQGVSGTPLANAITAVMAPGYYSYLDSKQLQGMLVGAKGAAELENLEGRPDRAMRIMDVQSWAHLLILLLVVVGNLGYLLSRRGNR